MPQNILLRCLTYSSAIHMALIGWLVLANFSKKIAKNYYTVDFVGGLPSSGFQDAVKKAQERETIKTKVVNPQEDLLIKSKKKLTKKEKEIVSEVPPIPLPPVSKSLSGVGKNVSSDIPESAFGSGIGIGFGGGSGAGSGGGAGNFPYTWYVHSLRKKLDSQWKVAGGFSHRIYAQVVFTVRKDGSLAEIELEESSKNEIFDLAALRAVETASPLPPLPSDFSEPDLRVHVRFTVKR